jgi:hypothetical protein
MTITRKGKTLLLLGALIVGLGAFLWGALAIKLARPHLPRDVAAIVPPTQTPATPAEETTGMVEETEFFIPNPDKQKPNPRPRASHCVPPAAWPCW